MWTIYSAGTAEGRDNVRYHGTAWLLLHAGMSVLRTELWPSARIISSFNHWAVSPAPDLWLQKHMEILEMTWCFFGGIKSKHKSIVKSSICFQTAHIPFILLVTDLGGTCMHVRAHKVRTEIRSGTHTITHRLFNIVVMWSSLREAFSCFRAFPAGKNSVILRHSQVVVPHTHNSSSQELEAGRSLSSRLAWSTEWVPGQPGLYRETLSWKTKTKRNKDSGLKCLCHDPSLF